MSRWRALASVHDIPDSALRERLIEALETLHYVADALEVAPGFEGESGILAAIEGMRDERDRAIEATEESDARAVAAEARLEDKLQADPGEVATLRQERDDALARIEALQPLIDSYSDCLAFARAFVTKGEAAGLKTRHVRSVGKKRVTK